MPAHRWRDSDNHGAEHALPVELALILGLARRQPPDRLAPLTARVDFPVLAAELQRMKLLGLLGTRLLRGAEPGQVPDSFADSVAFMLEAAGSVATEMQLLTWGLLEVLAQQGVVAMPLKGPFLAKRLHGDAAMRLSHDIDLLVSPAQMSTAVQALEGVGCIRPRSGEALPRLHHVFRSPGGFDIELHWRIHWYEAKYATTMLGRSRLGDGVRVPDPADELVSLLLFHARDGLAGLRTPIDVAAWWDQHQPAMPVSELRAILDAYPRLRAPVTAAALAVERVLGLPVAGLLGASPSPRWRVRAAVRLADWALDLPVGEADAATKLVDGLLAGFVGLPSFLSRALLPRLGGRKWTRPFRQLLYALALMRHARPLVGGLIRGADAPAGTAVLPAAPPQTTASAPESPAPARTPRL